MKKLEYKKLQYDYIDNIDKIKNNKFLNMYLYLYMRSNAYGEIQTTLETISEVLEMTYDKRSTKIEEYKEILNIMNNDITDENNNIILSQILTYNKELEVLNKNNININTNNDIINKDILNINLLAINEDITTKYIKIYYEEYNYLFNICKTYYKDKNKRINSSTLVNLYFYLKYKIKINQVLSNNKEIGTLLSLVKISQKLNINIRTVNTYLNILQEYNMITFEKGQYTNESHTQRESSKYWLNNKWLDFDEEEIKNENSNKNSSNINNIIDSSSNSKVTNISKYLKEG
mgnify:CR=1 FL=1